MFSYLFPILFPVVMCSIILFMLVTMNLVMVVDWKQIARKLKLPVQD